MSKTSTNRNMVNKAIVGLKAKGSMGKTDSLHELATFINDSIPHVLIYSDHKSKTPGKFGEDFRAVYEINGRTVAIESQGDPNTGLHDRLTDLCTEYSPDLIFCATRSYGGTVESVENIADTNGYELIWTSPYETMQGVPRALTLNKHKGRHLFGLARDLQLV